MTALCPQAVCSRRTGEGAGGAVHAVFTLSGLEARVAVGALGVVGMPVGVAVGWLGLLEGACLDVS